MAAFHLCFMALPIDIIDRRGPRNEMRRQLQLKKIKVSLASQTAFFRFSLWWWKKGSGPVHRRYSS